MQGFEIGVAGVQRVGVSAVGVELQRAVSPGEGAGGDRAGSYAVGTLHVVGQDVTGQGQQGFRSSACVAVIHGFWQVVDDVHIESRVGGGAIVIDHGDGELLRQIVGAVGGWMGFVVDQGVAVADDASGCVETGDGQRAAQRCGDRLWETGGHAVGDDGDAADGQRGDAVECSDGEGAVLSQCR